MTLEEQEKERQALIDEGAKALAYMQVRIFSKELLIKTLKDETQVLQEYIKLELLYTSRNAIQKRLEDI